MSMSTGGGHRLTSTKPSAEMATEPNAPANPRVVTPSGERSTNSPTPTRPTNPAPMRTIVARSPSSGRAMAITAKGDAACTVDASPPGRL